MAVAFTNLSWWLWNGKRQEPELSNGSSSSSSGLGLWESDAMKFQLIQGLNMTSLSRRKRRKWNCRGEQKIDKEYDVVLVPSDGGCVSGSESDDSDWSIGWSEPHGPEFHTDDDLDNSFAVIVPCYGRVNNDEMGKNKISVPIGNLMDSYYDESKKYMEQWLSSLKNT